MRKRIALSVAALLGLAAPASSEACGTIIGALRFTSAPAEPTARALWANPTLRVNVGGAQLFAPGPETHVAVDLTAGAFIGWPIEGSIIATREKPGVWLVPEVSYSHRATSADAEVHLALLGVGVGYGTFDLANLVYAPRFVAGRIGDQTTLGFRHGLSGHFAMTLFSVELSHQLLSTSGVLSQELLFSVGLNPLGLTPIVRWLAG
jgi:hypothetical protein